MKQSRATSLLKSTVSTAVGFAVALAANALVLPFFGYTPTLAENIALTTIYTVISIARGYALERLFEAMGWRTRMSAFALAVLAERQRQIQAEGYDEFHDGGHTPRELAQAGAAYFIGERGVTLFDPELADGRRVRGFNLWPWSDGYKPSLYDERRDLVRGCALGLAAGERSDLNRKRKSEPRDWDNPRPPNSGYQPSAGRGTPTKPPNQGSAGVASFAHGKTAREHAGPSQ